MTDAPKLPTGDSRAVVVILFLLQHVQCWECSVLENDQWNSYMLLILHKCDCLVKKSIHWWLHATELFVMWSVAVWSSHHIIPVPCHMCRFLWPSWGLDTRWCVQRVSGRRLGCGHWEMGCEVVALVVAGGRHAPLNLNTYCVYELAQNTLLFYLLTIVASAYICTYIYIGKSLFTFTTLVTETNGPVAKFS